MGGKCRGWVGHAEFADTVLPFAAFARILPSWSKLIKTLEQNDVTDTRKKY